MSWYSGLKVNESNFCRLARSFFGIQMPVFGNKLSLRSGDIEGLAYADQKTNSIVVHTKFMRGTHEFFNPYDWPTRLELFDAIIIHEAAHFLLSPKTIGGFEVPGRKLTSNIASIANTVEDLYIEGYVERSIPNFRSLLYNMNDMLFPDDMILERRNRISGERPTSMEEAYYTIEYAISFKRHNYLFIPRSDFERTLYEMYMSVLNMDDVEERKKLVYEIYDFIFDPEQQEKDSSEDEGDGEGGFGFGAGDGEGDEEVSENAVLASFGKDGKPVVFVPTPNYFSQEIDNTETTPVYHVEISEHKDIFVDRVKPGERTETVRFTDMDFSELAKIENARGAVRSVVGAPAYSGKHIKHLHRAGGDGKIFGELKLDGHRAGKGSPEVVFLLDFSGSMRGSLGGIYGGNGSKVEFALSAAVAINNALSKTKTKFAILGHTITYRGDKYGLLMVELKGMNEIVGDDELRTRCRRVHGSIKYSGNADGAALIYASKEFSKSSGDKVLFIVSDGQPAEDFTGYYTDNGVPESKLVDSYGGIMENVATVANHLRGKGVKLFSASIDSAAVEPCNRIYGERNNVEVKEVRQLVQMVMSSLN